MSSSASPKPTSAGTPSRPSAKETKTNGNAIQNLVKSLHFAWFSAHVFALLGAILYLLSSIRLFKSRPTWSNFWYRESYLASIFALGITVKRTIDREPRGPDPQKLVRDDNVQYLILSVLWLFTAPSVLTLIPFVVFSFFHALSYLGSTILPALGYDRTDPKLVKLNDVTTKYRQDFMMVSAYDELVLLAKLFVGSLNFKKGGFITFMLFFSFIRLRYAQSVYTRTAVRNTELKLDNFFGNTGNATIRQGWITFKGYLSRYLGTPTSTTAGTPASH